MIWRLGGSGVRSWRGRLGKFRGRLGWFWRTCWGRCRGSVGLLLKYDHVYHIHHNISPSVSLSYYIHETSIHISLQQPPQPPPAHTPPANPPKHPPITLPANPPKPPSLHPKTTPLKHPTPPPTIQRLLQPTDPHPEVLHLLHGER